MKVVILAGGFGTRLSEYTETVPKPMVSIGGIPIIQHIMSIYSKFGFNDFYIALGYKSHILKNYFLNFHDKNSDFTIDLKNNSIKYHKKNTKNWKVSLIETGDDSMTGGRLLRMKDYMGDETFMMTYGDGLSDINLKTLLNFHKKNGKSATVTAVRPIARFGNLVLNKDNVESFSEKPQVSESWINGGFFVFEKEIFNYIDNDKTVLEKQPLENLASQGNLNSYKHEGFWHCMDSKRDKDYLEEIYLSKKIPWINN